MAYLTLAVFLSFFVAIAYGAVRLRGMDEAELSRHLQTTGARVGSGTAALTRAPLAWLVAATFAVVMASALLVLELSESRVALVVGAASAIGWIASTGLALCASYLGRPAFLVLPQLRRDEP
jgi:hypothetical protein